LKIEISASKFELKKFNGKGNLSESVFGATWSSQDHARKISKTCRYVRWGLGGDGPNYVSQTRSCTT